MRCNYLPIWFICSCRERPSIRFTLEEPNSHFDLKCNFQQSWSQQFGQSMAQACAGRTKEGWKGERTEIGKGAGGHFAPAPPHKCRKQFGLPACWVQNLTSGQPCHHLCPTPDLLWSQHTGHQLWKFHRASQTSTKSSRKVQGKGLKLELQKLRNSGAEGSHSLQ